MSGERVVVQALGEISATYNMLRDAYGQHAGSTFLDALLACAAAEDRAAGVEQFERDLVALRRGEWRAVRARLDERPE